MSAFSDPRATAIQVQLATLDGANRPVQNDGPPNTSDSTRANPHRVTCASAPNSGYSNGPCGT